MRKWIGVALIATALVLFALIIASDSWTSLADVPNWISIFQMYKVWFAITSVVIFIVGLTLVEKLKKGPRNDPTGGIP